MANPEYVEILQQGVKVWNKWRKQHYEIRPSLSGADLRGADLILADLTRVDLRGADLTLAELTRADLGGSNFTDANLIVANLRRANLAGVNLTRANLTGANLSGANLVNANLSGANLSGANLLYAIFKNTAFGIAKFNNASLGSTTFDNTDLSEAIGLETVNHLAPSEIGIGTLYLSQGKIPESFLRGCGVPESFIVQMHALIASTEPIQFYSCFISYSSRNQDFAEHLYADLQNRGVRCWYAPEDLKIGDKIRDRIDESIRLRDKLLLILSEHSIASEWVEHEVESALEEERQRGRTILFPVRIDDAVMESKKAWAAMIRRTRHIGDFRQWKEHDQYQKAFKRLLRDLKAEEKR